MTIGTISSLFFSVALTGASGIGFLVVILMPAVFGWLGTGLMILQIFNGYTWSNPSGEQNIKATVSQVVSALSSNNQGGDNSSESSETSPDLASIADGQTNLDVSQVDGQNDTCAKYDGVSVCFFGDAKKMYNSATGALSGTLANAVKDGVAITNWHTAHLKDNYKFAPAFLLFATPEDIENNIHANVSAYACHMQVVSSSVNSSLNINTVINLLKKKASNGDVCSSFLINTLGEDASAQIFSGKGGALTFIMLSASPSAAFDQEAVHELSHGSDFNNNLSKTDSVYAKMYDVLAQYYPKQISVNAIEQKLQDEKVCFGSALLLADRVVDGGTIIQPYNIASSAQELFAYSATATVLSNIATNLNKWLGSVVDTSVENKCRQEVRDLMAAHIEYDINYKNKL